MAKNKSIGVSGNLSTIDWLNIGLLVLACGCIVILLWSITIGNKDIDITRRFQHTYEDSIPELKLVKKSLQYYERILGRRKLFVGQSGIKKKMPLIGLEQGVLISDLQLLGIISGAQGPQAIIANTKTDQSFNCYGGENIGDFVVKKVLTNKVILEKGGETVELRL